MFKRLIYEEWQSVIPVAAFVLTVVGFAILTARAVFMKPDKSKYLSRLPLNEGTERADEEKGGGK